MSRRKKTVYIFAAVLAGLVLMTLAVWLFYRNAPFGFARKVSQAEQQQRLHLVQTAEKWLGCNEADGSHQPIIDLYNTQDNLPMDYEVQYTDSWCATFVTAAAMETGLGHLIPPECGCERQIHLFQNMGSWQEKVACLTGILFKQRNKMTFSADLVRPKMKISVRRFRKTR